MGRAAAATQHNLEEVGLLVDALAHELRSPLTAIAGLAELLGGTAGARLGALERDALVTRLAANATRMETLLANLLDLRRAEVGALRVRCRPTDLAALVRRVVGQVDLRAHPVEVVVEQPEANVDGFVVERIIENLVSNAVRHTPAGTRVRIAVTMRPSAVELTVADDGSGIPAELRDGHFDPFRQGDAGAGGIGLGLSLVRRFADLHGGRAWLDEAPGGAAIHVLLSTAEGGGVPEAGQPPARKDSGGGAGGARDRHRERRPVAVTPPQPPACDLMPVGMLVADACGRVVTVNRMWSELSGLDAGASHGAGWLSVFDEPERGHLLDHIRRISGGDGPSTVDCVMRTAPERRWTRWWFRGNGFRGDAVVVMAVADAQADHLREDELLRLATHDPLTGLFNRSQFFEFTEQALRGLERERTGVAVVFVDLDRFKAVNDTRGHRVGDQVLCAAADALRRAVRPHDVVARVGGDEFAVLCEGFEAEGLAGTVAQRIREELGRGVEVDRLTWSLDATVGVATTRSPYDTPGDLLDRADRAMYHAKATRRGIGASMLTNR